nr:MAG: hypothetical protein 1 [Tombusviridae sp.]
MGIEFLSAPLPTKRVVESPVQFGSVDYSDPRIVEALGASGLKGRSTTLWGQIVTALKMAWWLLLLPAVIPRWIVRKVLCAVCGLFCRVRRCIEVIRNAILDGTALLREVTNRRVRALGLVTFIIACTGWGLYGALSWVALVVGYCFCFLPTDLRFFIHLKAELQRAWDVALVSDELETSSTPQPVKIKNTFACRLAVRAISRVGLLSPTKANALVYQKVILDDMRELNVRCADRVRVLPLAIAACLHRPEEVSKVEGCIAQLFSNNTGL